MKQKHVLMRMTLTLLFAALSAPAFSAGCDDYPFTQGINVEDVNGGIRIISTAEVSASFDDIELRSKMLGMKQRSKPRASSLGVSCPKASAAIKSFQQGCSRNQIDAGRNQDGYPQRGYPTD